MSRKKRDKRTAKRSNKKVTTRSKLDNWASTATIIGLLVALIALIPTGVEFFNTWLNELRSKSNIIQINESNLSFTNRPILVEELDHEQTYEDSPEIYQECAFLVPESCEPHIYTGIRDEIATANLYITSRSGYYPIIIDGLVMTLKSYRPLESAPINVLFSAATGGGGGEWTVYTIDNISWLKKEVPLDLQTAQYQVVTDQHVNAVLDCINQDCDKILYVAPQEVEGLRLEMPFLKAVSSGWYQFDIQIRYTYRGESLISREMFSFEYIMPEVIHPWYSWHSSEDEIRVLPANIEVNLINKSVNINASATKSDNPSGTLILQTSRWDSALDDAYYSWNVATGEIQHIGKLGFLPYTFSPRSYADKNAVSPDGWKRAIELSPTTFASADLGIIDLRQAGVANVTNSSGINEFQPAWSPSGDRITYVAFAVVDGDELRQGEADLYVYDLRTKAHTRVTYTPTEIEGQPIWIDENNIAFLLPEILGATKIQNYRFGLGIVNTETGTTRYYTSYSPTDFDDLYYLENSNLLAIPKTSGYILIDTEGEAVAEIDLGSSAYEECIFPDLATIGLICKSLRGIDLVGLDSPRTLYNIENNKARSVWLGTSAQGGFVILDLGRGEMLQFGENLQLIKKWELPNANLLSSWSVSDIIFISP